MTLKFLLITGMACTLLAGQSYAQTSKNTQAKNKETLNGDAEQNKRTAPYMQLGDIKGEVTKKVQDGDCDDTTTDCKTLKSRAGRVKYSNITLKKNKASDNVSDGLTDGKEKNSESATKGKQDGTGDPASSERHVYPILPHDPAPPLEPMDEIDECIVIDGINPCPGG